MLQATVTRLRCPQPSEDSKAAKKGARCAGTLKLEAHEWRDLPGTHRLRDVFEGSLGCESCGFHYPILGGVAIVLEDPLGYLLAHAKGVSKFIPLDRLPGEIREEFEEVLRDLEAEAEHAHQEEDLEAERVNALYLMNHYLRVSGAGEKWWIPQAAEAAPLHAELIERHWDQGPIMQVAAWLKDVQQAGAASIVELGCGVGGVWRESRGFAKSYLGLDSAFASIVRARHLALGAEPAIDARIPDDLLKGGVSRPVQVEAEKQPDGRADFIVADVENPPLAAESFDVSVAMNLIDMLEAPWNFPKTQLAHLRAGGRVLQSCPYIWHPRIAGKLRSQLPRGLDDSAAAIEHLYAKAGFTLERRMAHIPWLFFKHARQLELYSVHLIEARKN